MAKIYCAVALDPYPETMTAKESLELIVDKMQFTLEAEGISEIQWRSEFVLEEAAFALIAEGEP